MEPWCTTHMGMYLHCSKQLNEHFENTSGASFITVAYAQNLPWRRHSALATQKGVIYIKTNLTGKFLHMHTNFDPCIQTFFFIWREKFKWRE